MVVVGYLCVLFQVFRHLSPLSFHVFVLPLPLPVPLVYPPSCAQVESKTAAEWDEMLTTAHTLIFARCSAKQRAKAVQALQHAGHLVCMCATDDNNILALEVQPRNNARSILVSKFMSTLLYVFSFITH